ncbi:uncharacterized protein At2g29880-like [Impatiens glandulifera]|uniref:uncharacterized protein At2g29880-like n=1 Tax=Impatiens glandulifera TaxID=253017 RepID=UPI001FB10410|nr:uncharacterized protein At2g29880-like [Impatiens glandulifera]
MCIFFYQYKIFVGVFSNQSYIFTLYFEKIRRMKTKSYLKWTSMMDNVLTNVLLEQHNLGNHPPNGWKSVAYAAAVSALHNQCNVNVSRENIQSRLKTWDKHYAVISAMLGTSGFGWDWDRKVVKVDSEEVWTTYVKAHPDASHYRSKIVENWEDLSIICGQDKANGSGAETADEGARAMFEDIESCSKLSKESTSVERPSKRTRHNDMATAISKMADVVGKAYNVEKTSAQQVFDELSKITDLEETQFLQAVDVLTTNERKYEVFLTIPERMRRAWILLQIKK